MKFILIGNTSVGKTSLTWRYKFDEFRENLNPTIGVDVQTKSYSMFSTDIKILLWDTAGQERFNSISSVFYRDSIGVFVCFDYTNYKSFLDVEQWLELILDNIPEYAHIILVGLKKDLVNNIQVSEEEAKRFAENHDMKFYSVSSKTGENIEKMFMETAEDIYCDVKTGRLNIEEDVGGLRVQEEPKKRYSCLWPW